MKKIERVYFKILENLKSGLLGKSGERFLTVRELAEKYKISYVSATKILSDLLKLPNLIQIGNQVYILNGIANKNCELFKKIKRTEKVIGFHVSQMNNMFSSQIIENFITLAHHNGYEVVVMSSNYFDDAIKRFVLMGCQAVIAFEREKSEYIESLALLPVPSVIIGNTFKFSYSHYVTTNNFSAAETVAKHLYDCNYSKFCYVGPNPEKESRFSGFKQMLLNLGVAEENITTYNSVNDKAPLELINVIKTASETNRIGIFCFHDVIALSIYSDIKKYKKNIPQEIGIVGFDNLSISDILTPRLTSVYYNFNELASLAFHTAISSINNESAPIVKNVTVPSLIIKESTKKTINSF